MGYRPGTVRTLVQREEKLWEKIQGAEQPINMDIWKDDDTLLEKHLTTYESLWTKAIDRTTFKKPCSQ